MNTELFTIAFSAVALCGAPAEGTISDRAAGAFVADLIENKADLDEWVLEPELQASRRLGIRYHGVVNKFLISYDMSEEIRDLARNGSKEPRFEVEALDPVHARLSLTFDGIDGELAYYFEGEKLVSPVFYHARAWDRIETDYFVVFASNPSAFNRYAADRLDSFVESAAKTLRIPEDRSEQLKREKIHYFLCDGADEIRELTGYDTRGMYNLAYDYVISTFNCHYHEIVHLLVNYTLGDCSLDVHPFFQEGIAVALGGRGGKEQAPILELGYFLEQSQSASWRDFLSYDSHRSTDASVTYPVIGLYNRFLLDHEGAERFFDLYERYSGAGSRSGVSEADLPGFQNWAAFLEGFAGEATIVVPLHDEPGVDTIYAGDRALITQRGDRVHFAVAGTVLTREGAPPAGFESEVFGELCPDRRYRGEKYLVTADDQEVSIYNLYTNNLVAKYVSSMTAGMEPVRKEEGFYKFSVSQSVFDVDLKRMTIEIVPAGR